MKRIITYDELPNARGESIYLRMETDPALYMSLLSKGYRIINHIKDADEQTIYVTGKRQDYEAVDTEDYKRKFEEKFEGLLKKEKITKPKTTKFSYFDLKEHKYALPFVLKNENQNGGREKFLIATEEDYEHLIQAFDFLLDRKMHFLTPFEEEDMRRKIDYQKYIDSGFMVQEYIKTPTKYNTSLRLLTTPSYDLIYAMLKYKKPETLIDDTTLLGYLLRDVYPLSTKSIVSNTLSGGENIVIGSLRPRDYDRLFLKTHKIESEQFQRVVEASQNVHEKCKKELGIICAFDYIYDQNKDKWYFLEYHSRPMVGEYARRHGLPYTTNQERIEADGRTRATALATVLQKTR